MGDEIDKNLLCKFMTYNEVFSLCMGISTLYHLRIAYDLFLLFLSKKFHDMIILAEELDKEKSVCKFYKLARI